MYQKEVTTKDGNVKNVIAGSQEELDEAVKVLKGDEAPRQPDINDPKDGNKIVSPDNLQRDTAAEVNRVKEVDPDVAPTPKPVEGEDVAVGQGAVKKKEEAKEEKIDVKVKSKK